VLALSVVATSTAAAQVNRGAATLPAPIDTALHRLFASQLYASSRFGPAHWRTGDTYTTVQPSPDDSDAVDIVEYSTTSRKGHIVVSAAQLTPAAKPGTSRPAPLDVENYQFSPDGARVLIFTNSKRVWRQNTRGDFWVLDLATNKLHKLGGPEAPESSLMYAKFSPLGDKVAYVRGGDLWVEGVKDGRITRLTNTATRTLVNGMTDWVYEEEFDLRDGFRWAPDGHAIAYWQFDMTGVRDFLLINDTDSLYPFSVPVQYPKAGTTNSAVRVGVVPVTGGASTWVTVTGDPREHYIPRMEWVGPDRLIIQRMNRLQNQDDVLMADAKTGVAKTVMTERDAAWVDVVDTIRWVNGRRDFLWISERDGWRHVYQVSRDGSQTRLLTPGPYDVIDVAAVDDADGWLYIIASPSNATQRYLERVPLSGARPPERLSPMGEPGTHRYDISSNAHWAFETYSSHDVPPVTRIVALPSHAVVDTLATNARTIANVRPLLGAPMEFFKVTLPDSASLDGWMIKPANFDSTKKYPLLVYVYGEPAAQTVLDAWGGNQMLWYRWLANEGYVVMSVDNRGTPAPKGRAWRKVIYGAVGPLSSREQADAVRVVAHEHSFIDAARVAIWGWSGGGSSTLNAMFRYPGVYQVGMAVAPVADQRLYDTIYQERYMGLPQDNTDGYRRSSPINFAEGLEGKLLVMHGSGDDNVHYQGTERLVNRLVALDKQFNEVVYPNRTHCICEGAGTTLHVYSTLTRFLMTNLPAGGR